jgi:hypothetical protein
LEEKGIIKISKRMTDYKKGSNYHNEYRFIYPWPYKSAGQTGKSEEGRPENISFLPNKADRKKTTGRPEKNDGADRKKTAEQTGNDFRLIDQENHPGELLKNNSSSSQPEEDEAGEKNKNKEKIELQTNYDNPCLHSTEEEKNIDGKNFEKNIDGENFATSQNSRWPGEATRDELLEMFFGAECNIPARVDLKRRDMKKTFYFTEYTKPFDKTRDREHSERMIKKYGQPCDFFYEKLAAEFIEYLETKHWNKKAEPPGPGMRKLLLYAARAGVLHLIGFNPKTDDQLAEEARQEAIRKEEQQIKDEAAREAERKAWEDAAPEREAMRLQQEARKRERLEQEERRKKREREDIERQKQEQAAKRELLRQEEERHKQLLVEKFGENFVFKEMRFRKTLPSMEEMQEAYELEASGGFAGLY